MPKVQLKQAIDYIGPRQAGDVFSVTAKLAARWTAAGIAVELPKAAAAAKPTSVDPADADLLDDDKDED